MRKRDAILRALKELRADGAEGIVSVHDDRCSSSTCKCWPRDIVVRAREKN